jgi:hypothetical protein
MEAMAQKRRGKRVAKSKKMPPPREADLPLSARLRSLAPSVLEDASQPPEDQPAAQRSSTSVAETAAAADTASATATTPAAVFEGVGIPGVFRPRALGNNGRARASQLANVPRGPL